MNLYPYQEEGVAFLVKNPRAYLADGMGLGKTVQACAAAKRCGVERALVVAPASALPNWQREWARWEVEAALTVVSYDRLAARPGQYDGREYDVVILDEAHYCKTRNTQRTIAALGVARECDRSWLLSGTPMPNHPGELWPPVRALWPRVAKELGIASYGEWLSTFARFKPTPWGIKVYGMRNAAKLRPFLNRFLLRRKLDQVGIQLPPLRIDVSLLERNGALDSALERWDADFPAIVAGMIREEENENGSLSRLRRLLGKYKAPRIGELLADELRERQYDKLVVLAHHHDTLDTLWRILKPFGAVGFDGSASPEARQLAIDLFQSEDGPRVFIAQQTAAGIAINLQAAAEIVLVEPAWSPDENAQAIKRIHRIGQKAPCRARIFGVAGTLDEGIMETIARKVRMQCELNLES